MTTVYANRLSLPQSMAVDITILLDYLKLPQNTSQMGLVRSLLDTATEMIESYVGVCCITQTWRFVANRWHQEYPKSFHGQDVVVRYPGCAIKSMKLTRGPVQSISNLKVSSADGTMGIIDPADYQWEITGHQGVISNAYGRDLPNPSTSRFGIRAEAVLGYGNDHAFVPTSMKTAIMTYVSYLYEHRDMDPKASGLPMHIQDLVRFTRDIHL